MVTVTTQSAYDEEDECEVGELMERFKFPKRVSSTGAKEKKKKKENKRRGRKKKKQTGAENLDEVVVKGQDEDLWTKVPDEVMRLIVHRLSFSDFCSLRCVSKKWNTLVVYPAASLMSVRNSFEAPLCVVFTGTAGFIGYNPALHSWCRLPGTFGSSFGALGFSGDKYKVLAGTDGLLVVESTRMGLWVVNPINKTERCIAEHRYCGRIFKVLIHSNALNASFKVLVFSDMNRARKWRRHSWSYESIFELLVYDSVRDCWLTDIDGDVEELKTLTCVVEYNGVLCCLRGSDTYEHIYILRLYPDDEKVAECTDVELDISDSGTEVEFKPSFEIADDFPDLPRDLEACQLIVQGGNLMLGGVRTDVHQYGEAVIWKLDKPDHGKAKWIQVARMQWIKFDLYPFYPKPMVFIRGEYMWITVWDTDCLEVAWSGIMCHIPSNSWWKLPNLSDNPQLGLNTGNVQQDTAARKGSARKPKKMMISTPRHLGEACMPFLFEPKMSLVA